jgi:hypothetical protein
MSNSAATIDSLDIENAPPGDETVPVKRIDPPIPQDEDYFPMFFASLQAGALAILSQLLTAIYFAFQMGASIEMRAFASVIPYLAFGISPEGFRVITMWSSLTSAGILASFSILAFVRRGRLQVKAGRLFGWLNITLIGLINLARELYFDDFGVSELWMWVLVLVGCVAFAVGNYIIWVDFDDRMQELKQ